MLKAGMTIKEYKQGLDNAEFSAREGAEFYLKEIAERDESIGAYLEVWREQVLVEADEADKKIKAGTAGWLEGVPIVIKDNILIEGRIATAGSKMLENYRAAYSSTVATKLSQAGALFLGRTNMDEFAFGSSTEQSAWQVTRNPYDLERVPGGTSGGSAAAVAAGLALAGFGTDTGGSIRQPASFCGVVGLRPTYGAVSRYGIVAAASSFDQPGPIARTAADAAELFKVIAGKDKFDSRSRDFRYAENLIGGAELVAGTVLGLPKEWLDEEGDFKGVDESTKTAMRLARKRLEQMGVTFRPVSLARSDKLLAAYYISIFAEESSNLSRFDGLRYAPVKEASDKTLTELYQSSRSRGFGPEAKRRIILGNFVLSSGFYDAYYGQAQKVRRLVRREMDEILKQVDALFLPTAPTVAFKIGEKVDDPLAMYYGDLFTVLASLSGSPALTVPVEQYRPGSGNLPVGWQVVGKDGAEGELLTLAHYYEQTY